MSLWILFCLIRFERYLSFSLRKDAKQSRSTASCLFWQALEKANIFETLSLSNLVEINHSIQTWWEEQGINGKPPLQSQFLKLSNNITVCCYKRLLKSVKMCYILLSASVKSGQWLCCPAPHWGWHIPKEGNFRSFCTVLQGEVNGIWNLCGVSHSPVSWHVCNSWCSLSRKCVHKIQLLLQREEKRPGFPVLAKDTIISFVQKV